MDSINFQNRDFSFREIELPEVGNVLISVNSLNELLVDKTGAFISDEAITIDENIYYFVDDKDIKLSESDLIKLIVNEVK